MKILDPKVLLGGASLVLVGMLAFRDVREPGPGPLHPAHAAMPELVGRGGCVLCHGDPGTPAAMIQGCLACHEEIDQQLEAGTGLHGQLRNKAQAGARSDDTADGAAVDSAVDPAGVARCDVCHGEHHGDSTALAGDFAFVRAGFASLGGFDHGGLDFRLGGVHAEVGCVACHANADVDVLPKGATRFLGLESTCTHCHEDPHEGAMPATCADCHGESEPFASVALFEHPGSFPLAPPHADLACDQCHERGALSASTPGVLGHLDGKVVETRTCAECHDSSHSPAFLAEVATGCAGCHGDGAPSFREANLELTASLHHATGFPLDGAHASIDCASCHQVDGEFSERFPHRSANDCAACHGDVHRGAFDRGPVAGSLTATEEALGPVGCATCHSTESFASTGGASFDHARWTGFALTGSHASGSCTSCHGEAADGTRSFGFVADVYPGDPGKCSTCHGDVHAGAFFGETLAQTALDGLADLAPDEGGPGQVAEDCADCHTTASFLLSGSAPFDHARWTGFPLAGAHVEADCAGCHGPSSAEPRNFGFVADFVTGDSRQCSTCHESPHRTRFDEQRHPETGQLDCRACHTERDFLEIKPGSFDHGEATGFALVGAHAQAKCTVCHVPAEEALTRLGQVAAQFSGNTGRCDTCHNDPHRGAFRGRTGQLAAAAGGDRGANPDCATCHQPTSFHVNEPFAHGQWTGWALENSHADLKCSACHAAQAPDSQGRTHGFAAGAKCADCHEDPHLGQFRSRLKGASTDGSCARCHTTSGAFSVPSFDHSTARFALDETHAELDCSACHKAATTRQGGQAVRYRPLGRECVDCHGTGAGRSGTSGHGKKETR